MLSRSNTTTNSDRLRRAKSAASMKAAASRQRSSSTSDPFVVRQHAEAAATQAYKRANPVEKMSYPEYRPAPPMLQRRKSQVTGRSEGSYLEDARLGRRRSTARRDENKSTPTNHQRSRRDDYEIAVKEVSARPESSGVRPHLVAQPTARRERLISTANAYHRKLLSSTGSDTAESMITAPTCKGASSAATPRHTEKSYDDGISVTYTEPQTYADRSNTDLGSRNRRVSIRETQTDEEIIALARDRRLQDFQQHKLRERKSFFGSFQKLQRGSVTQKQRSDGITYDSSLPPFNYADDSLIAPLPPTHDMAPIQYLEVDPKLTRKTRLFSGSVKGRIKKLLRKASRAPSGILSQPAEAKISHSSAADEEEPSIIRSSMEMSDPFVTHDLRPPSGHTSGTLFQQSSTGSNTSVSNGSVAARSRVTSWTNSTVAGTTSTCANTASLSAADEHGRLRRSNSASTLRKKSSFFGRAVQNRLRKSSRADLKDSSEDGQALFAALRERISPQDQPVENRERTDSVTSEASRVSSALSSLPSRQRAGSLAPSANGRTSTIRTVSPDVEEFKMQMMSPVVEASPDRDDRDEVDEQTPTANRYSSKRRAAPAMAAPPSPERIARRIQQSQARWQSALRATAGALDGKTASVYDGDNPYELPSPSRNVYPNNTTDTGGLPQHAKVTDQTARNRERLLSPSLYSRATDGASPRPTTPEEGGTVVTITGREVKRYEISPPKKPDLVAQRPVQVSNEWRKWLSDELNHLADAEQVEDFTLPQEVHPPVAVTTAESSSRVRTSKPRTSSQGCSSDTPTSDQTSKGQRSSRPRANSRRSSYMNERYPTIESSNNSGRQSQRTSRKYSTTSNAGTDTERSVRNQGSDNSKNSIEGTGTISNTKPTKTLPKRHSLAQLEPSSRSKSTHTLPAPTHTTSTNLTMSGAVPNSPTPLSTTKAPNPPPHPKHKSAFDLRARYTRAGSASSRPLEVRRKSTTTSPTPIAILEDSTILNISAGPYAALPSAGASANKENNKENTPPRHGHEDDIDGGNLPALSSSEWLAGPGHGGKKREGVVRVGAKDSGVKVGGVGIGVGAKAREGSPGQRLVTGWLERRRGRGDGEGGFV